MKRNMSIQAWRRLRDTMQPEELSDLARDIASCLCTDISAIQDIRYALIHKEWDKLEQA